MGKGRIIETYRFIGDSSVNKAKCIENGKTVGMYTQTDIIAALAEHREDIKGGFKLKTKEDDPRRAYVIYFGGTKDQPKQYVKIIFNKEILEMGDPNALAIENLCEYSVRVRKNNIKIGVLSAVGSIAIFGTLIGCMIWADQKESELKGDLNYEKL